MNCPFCKHADSRVMDSRAADDGNAIRRRRECASCGRRFTTYEVVEQAPLMVIKNDGCREAFQQEKLLKGLLRSCDKRDISTERIVALSHAIEREIRDTADKEIESRAIGELVMEKLKDFDEVAYIRFASVYRKFADISSFQSALESLLKGRETVISKD
ncbi:MAG TPA: transcriptional regulator NrdR [Selenomonas sp.]|nr:transcriptional repressor NrdR [Selenomonadaceae bacterium]HCB93254.1 transcriptional regulator NrdR [Selenomonas sp.]